MNKYIEASTIEEVIKTPMTCFLDKKTNTLHIHSKYQYKIFRNWVNDEIKLQRGESNAINQFKVCEGNN